MKATTAKEREFERRVSVHELPGNGLEVEFSAEAAELEAIARRIGIPAVEHLKITATLRGLEGGKVIEVTGTLDAAVTQECVATLEPVERLYREPLRVLFMEPVRARQESPPTGEEALVDAEEDDIELLVEDVVDVGEVAVQYLSLALDPYPRKEDAPDVDWRSGKGKEEADEPVRENPFSVLNKLRDKT